jgi:hypothetical protein
MHSHCNPESPAGPPRLRIHRCVFRSSSAPIPIPSAPPYATNFRSLRRGCHPDCLPVRVPAGEAIGTRTRWPPPADTRCPVGLPRGCRARVARRELWPQRRTHTSRAEIGRNPLPPGRCLPTSLLTAVSDTPDTCPFSEARPARAGLAQRADDPITTQPRGAQSDLHRPLTPLVRMTSTSIRYPTSLSRLRVCRQRHPGR